MKKYESSYKKLGHDFYSEVKPEKAEGAKLFAYNEELANEIGLNFEDGLDKELILSGNQTFLHSPISLVYAGHQFGHFNPKLGDGRACVIAESNGYDIQLKGSGRTPYSRRGDGKSPIGPVVREYLLSEAMHALGVPTTRSLAAVRTEEVIMRNTVSFGGVFTRVAKSHLRIGSFQYWAAKGKVEQVKELADYAIERLYPDIKNDKDLYLSLFREVAKKQVALIPKWMSVGFIHGVMNTDNTSISGETIDYGPCAFMDEFDYYKVFSSIDRDGRYAYGSQLNIIMWNLARFADSLLPLINSDTEKAVKTLEEELKYFNDLLVMNHKREFAKKLGLLDENYSDADDELVESFLIYLQDEKLDFTNSFRALGDLLRGNEDKFVQNDRFKKFKSRWLSRVSEKDIEKFTQELNLVNPYLIPRNHLIEEAIIQVNDNKYELFYELYEALKNPFQDNKDFAKFSAPPKESEVVKMTFCGT